MKKWFAEFRTESLPAGIKDPCTRQHSSGSWTFTDARTESVQDSGHHTVRKDIVIDSQSAVIELKCTHAGSTERNLSEEIAADMVHYDCDVLYFYIYDKAGIIDNPVSFKQTYEKKRVDKKTVHVVLYAHSDI